jgi:hypothetical protein
VTTILSLVARLEADVALLLACLGLVPHLAADVAFHVGTVVAPMTPLFAAETEVFGTVACVMGVDFVADFAF